MKTIQRRPLFFCMTTLVALALFCVTPLFAAKSGVVEQSTSSTNVKPLTKQQMYLFGSTLQAIREAYVDEVTDQEIIKNAVTGMLSNLDPHSAYLTPKELQELQSMTQGEFTGVGMEVTMQHGVVRVVSPIDDTPAAKAGIQAGDLIMRIDGQSVQGMSLHEAVMKMRGKRGTKVTLTILRKSVGKPFDVTIKRAKITVDSVKEKLLASHYGYIRISAFQEDTGKDVAQAVKVLRRQSNRSLRGLVLDLRNNPGGLLQQAVIVSDVFLDADKLGYDQKIVYTKGRFKAGGYVGKAKTSDQTGGVPIVVLVNGGSASAAEIVAAALQDHHRAVIMGTQTFGKGSVQTVLPLHDGELGALKLTTARYYTPAGRSIQAEGVTPDVVVENLKIPDSVKSTEVFSMTEADLKGQIGKGKSNQAADQESRALLKRFQSENTDAALIYEDYPLHQALALLKGLYAAKIH